MSCQQRGRVCSVGPRGNAEAISWRRVKHGPASVNSAVLIRHVARDSAAEYRYAARQTTPFSRCDRPRRNPPEISVVNQETTSRKSMFILIRKGSRVFQYTSMHSFFTNTIVAILVINTCDESDLNFDNLGVKLIGD